MDEHLEDVRKKIQKMAAAWNSMIGEWIGLAKNSQIPNPLGDNWIYNWPFGYLVADVGWQ